MKLINKTIAIVMMSAGLMLNVSANDLPSQTAHQVVEVTTNELVNKIEALRPLYEQDQDQFFAEVEGVLVPVIDFDRISRSVIAKYNTVATDEQRGHFSEVFKDSLVKTYAKGLLEYSNEKIVVLPAKDTDAGKDKVSVYMEIFAEGGVKYPLSYSMFVNEHNEWKLRNVIINGINLGLTFRNQFDQSMKTNGNDVDMVIANWSSQVKSESEDPALAPVQ